MPTGYTARLYEGEGQSFPEFAMECARAFGACVTLRDSPDTEAFQPSSYHTDALAKAEARLSEVQEWTLEDADADAQRAYDEACKARDAAEEQRRRISERYRAMLVRVHAWEPPTDEHYELREFMRSQLEEALKFDTGGLSHWPLPVRKSGSQHKADEIAAAAKDIAYHTKEHGEELKRAIQRTAWVAALRDSLAIWRDADEASPAYEVKEEGKSSTSSGVV